MSINPLGGIIDIVQGVAPLDFATARTGDYVSLKNWQGCLVVIVKGAGTDGDDQTFTLQQATVVAGTDAKDAAVIATYWEKEATALTSVGTWTKVTQTAATSIAPGDPTAQSQALYVFDVPADVLDVDNGFDCINVSNDGAGSNAQLGCILYLLYGPRYGAAPESLLSSIAD